ncbi:hypothetical protein GCM10009761_31490 [Agromyces terreus]
MVTTGIMRSEAGSARVAWVLIFVGVALLVFVGLSLSLRAIGGSAMSWCLVDASSSGAVDSGRPEDDPTFRYTVFPFGLECSLFAGDGRPRVNDFLDLGTVPLYAGISCLLVGSFVLLRHRPREPRSSDELSR